MGENFKGNQWRKFIGSRWFLLLLLTTSILVSFAYGRAYYQDYQVRQEIEQLKDEVKRVESKKIETIEMLKYVKSSAFIEEKARTELNLLKPGEKVAIIVGETKKSTSLETKSEIDNIKISNPLKWWHFFWQDLPK
ncbi:MAG: septum formation initiator family protein [bacterium]|nr:septum formation initiator family protein [bacterium]